MMPAIAVLAVLAQICSGFSLLGISAYVCLTASCQVVRLEDYVLLAGVLPILLTALDKTRQTACSAMHVIRRLLLNAAAQDKVNCS